MREYKDTLEDIENTLGEMYLERARYLLSADEMLEEMLSNSEITTAMKTANRARTVCCGMLVDADKAPVARTITGEQFLVCNDICKKLIEAATQEKISEILAQ